MALCYWHQKKPRSYELTFKPSVLSGKQCEEAWTGCWGGGREREPPKVPVRELKCFENLEMYMNNSKKNVCSIKIQRAIEPQREKTLLSEK